MLVDKQSELMSNLLFTVHQHGGDDVTWKPPQVVWKMCFKYQLNLPCVILSVILGTTYLVNSTFSKNYAHTYTQASPVLKVAWDQTEVARENSRLRPTRRGARRDDCLLKPRFLLKYLSCFFRGAGYRLLCLQMAHEIC